MIDKESTKTKAGALHYLKNSNIKVTCFISKKPKLFIRDDDYINLIEFTCYHYKAQLCGTRQCKFSANLDGALSDVDKFIVHDVILESGN